MAWDGRSLRFRERRSQRCATSLDSARLNRVTNKIPTVRKDPSMSQSTPNRAAKSRRDAILAGVAISAPLALSSASSAATPSNVPAKKRNTLDENDHGQGWCEDFLQGLGKGPADRLLARLAALVRRLGQSDAVLRSAWIPGCCP